MQAIYCNIAILSMGFLFGGALLLVAQSGTPSAGPLAKSPRTMISQTAEPSSTRAHGKATRRTRIRKQVAHKTAVQPQVAPAIPLTPEQMPANPPQVSYQNGQLTIQSQNSTLSDILSAVRRQTGALIEVPLGAASQRIATQLGPGPARDVIATLLRDSAFDFVIVGSPQHPGGIQRVILAQKSPAGAISQPTPTVAQGRTFGTFNRPTMHPSPAENQSDEADSDDSEPSAVEEPTIPEPQPEQTVQPDTQQPTAADQPQPPAQIQPGQSDQQPQSVIQPQVPSTQGSEQPNRQSDQGGQVKTPDQLLQELQRIQQQQQQR